MNEFIKAKNILIVLFLLSFIAIPLLIISFQGLPDRTILKESISVLIILGFFLMLSEFYLNRANKIFVKTYHMVKLIKFHKIIAYTVVFIFFIHPFLIVLPRFFEAGVDPLHAFWVMVTNFKSLGIIFGLIAWVLMIILFLTSFFRDKLNMSPHSWRVLHIILSILFAISALWHMIDLGRHSNEIMVIFIFLLVFIASLLLIKLYFFKNKKEEGVL